MENLSVDEMNIQIITHLDKKMESVLCDKPDLVVLAETCDMPSNYTQHDHLNYVRNRNSDVLSHMVEVAQRNNIFLVYPTIRQQENGKFLNSSYFISPQGEVLGIYDKNNLTIGEMEELDMQCGSGSTVITCALGKVAFVTCFDLNFVSLAEKYAKEKVDLILFSSAYHGGLMQGYWAYSNRTYFVGAVEKLQCTIIAPTGETLAASTSYYDYVVHTVNLDYAVVHLDYNYDKLKAAKIKYGNKIGLRDPGLLGSVLLTSETEKFTVFDIMREFGITQLDDYMQRTINIQNLNRKQ